MKFGQALIAVAGVSLSACASLPKDVTPELMGVVIDRATHRPIAGARVQIEQFPLSAVRTGNDGTFRIPPLPRWQAAWAPNAMPLYRITSEAPGYSRTVQSWYSGDSLAQVVTMRRPDALDDGVD